MTRRSPGPRLTAHQLDVRLDGVLSQVIYDWRQELQAKAKSEDDHG